MNRVKKFVEDNMSRLAELNTNVEIFEMEYISNLINKYSMGITDSDIFYVLSRLVLAKNNLPEEAPGLINVDHLTELQYMIYDLTDLIVELYDTDAPRVEIMPSEAEMIVCALNYSNEQLRCSHIDVFNHGIERMPQDITDYVESMNNTVKEITKDIQKIADNDEGTIIVRRANR